MQSSLRRVWGGNTAGYGLKTRLATLREFSSPKTRAASPNGRPPSGNWSVCLRLKDTPQPHFLASIPGQPASLMAATSRGAADGRVYTFDQVRPQNIGSGPLP